MGMGPFKRLMRRGIVLALVTLGAWPVMASRAQDFFTIADDLPIMPGLTEVPGSGFVFDKPDGRIAEAAARGRVNRDAVLRFYAEVLPQLGWTLASPGRFRRDAEGLSLVFSTEGRDLVVRIQVAPLKDR